MGRLHVPRSKTSDRMSFRPPTRPFAPPSAVRRAVPKGPVADSATALRRAALLGHNVRHVLIQRATYSSMSKMWADEFPAFAKTRVHLDDDISSHYAEAKEALPHVDFMNVPGADPHVDPNVQREDGRKTIKFDRTNPQDWDPHFFIATIIHELIHVVNSMKYQKNLVGGLASDEYFNVHLPEGDENGVVRDGMAKNQLDSLEEQNKILYDNWVDLLDICEKEHGQVKEGATEKKQLAHVKERITYGGFLSKTETDTVLFDIYFYMVQKNLESTATFKFAKRMLREAKDRRNKPGTKARRVEKDAYAFQLWKW